MAKQPRRPRGNGSPVTVRDMRIDDLLEVFQLGERLFTSEQWPTLYRTWDEYEVVSMFGTDSDTCIVAEVDDQVVGFLLGTMIEKRSSSWSYGYIVWLGVEPASSRLGIGRKLLEKITQRFRELGVRMLMADTAVENQPALSFFEREGFSRKTEHVYLAKNLSRDDGAPTRKPRPAKKPSPRRRK